ncbi:MAG: DUF58 domain-containing protein [Elusimicrobia bacterium]|nr:DUF58 domain-containing protein [Candidatus Obscuribacterium magneticum]
MPSLHDAAPEEILRQVRRIEIHSHKLVNEIFSGQYSSVFKGRGMEFSQVREYQPGDDPKLIDWNVTARLGHLFTKEFCEEREMTVMILIDASRSLFFGSRKNLKSELAAELAALLSFSAIRNNDKVGMLIFTNKVEKFLPPRKGLRNILRLVREILTFVPEGNTTNIASGLEFLGRVMKRRAVCFLMSDFLSPMNYEKAIRIVSKKHDLVTIRISDRLENGFTFPGRFFLRDMESNQLVFLELSGENDCNELVRTNQSFFQNWKRTLQKSRVDVIEVQTGEPYLTQLLSFFKARAKRFR